MRASLATTDEFDDDPPDVSSDREDDLEPRRRGGALPVRITPPIDPAGEFDDNDIVEFFELIGEGYGEFEIAVSLNWSQYEMERFLKDPERQQIMVMLKERRHDQVERAMHKAALTGNPTAMRTWLFCQARHRGWSDTRKIQIEAESRTEVVISVRQAVGEVMKGARTVAEIAAIQDAYLDDDDVVDAEVVEG